MPYKQYYELGVTTRKSPQYQEETFSFYDNYNAQGIERYGLAANEQMESYDAVHSKENAETEMIIPYHAVIKATPLQYQEPAYIADDAICEDILLLNTLQVIADIDGTPTPIDLSPEFSPTTHLYTCAPPIDSSGRFVIGTDFEIGVDADLHVLWGFGEQEELPLDNLTFSSAEGILYVYITEVGAAFDPENHMAIKVYTVQINW